MWRHSSIVNINLTCILMKKVILTSVIALLFGFGGAFAQSGSLTGVITDSDSNEPLPGATVFVTELTTGTTSNIDGEYTISNIPYGTYTVVYSFVGYRTVRRTVEINQPSTTINIALRFDAMDLDDVIVSGYAPVLKREVTGSISSISAQEIGDLPLQNTEALLQGRAAGVNITTDSGTPGGAFRIQIRGQGSINAATPPLYIVDGVPVSFSQLTGLSSSSPLNNLNPDDIESIEILKDASSAAIYGSQAAAGVVLITTKRGSEGRTRISLRAETGFRDATERVSYLNRDEFLDWAAEAHNFANPNLTLAESRENRVNFYRNNLFGSPIADPDNPLFADPLGRDLADTNWQEFVFDRGVTQRYNLSVTGGVQNTSFRIAGGYEDTEGTAYNSRFTRLNLRTSLDHQFNDRFSTGVTLNVARSTQAGVCEDGNFINCPPSQAMFEAPMSFPFLEDGSYNPRTRFGVDTNPAVTKNEVDRDVSVVSIFGNLTANYRFTDWLSVRGLVGVDYRTTEDFLHETEVARPTMGGRSLLINREVRNVTSNLVFSANQTFSDVHNVGGFVGVEYRENYSQSASLEARGFPLPFFRWPTTAADPFNVGGAATEFRFAGYFSTVRYNYDERYFLTFTGRYDGSSRFGADTRWGFFPSVSGAWRISDENFFNVSFIDDMRFRAGFGTTGNAAIGNFQNRGLYGAVGSYQGQVALTPTQLANVNLTWEEAQEINVGLDLAFLAGRINTTVDVYQKDTKKLLFGRPLPSDSGFGSIVENIGSVRNEGVEIELESVNLSTGDFTWRTRFNIAFMRNEVLSLPGEDGDTAEDRTINPNSFLSQIAEGQPIGQIMAIRWAGVNPADGRPMWYDADGNLTFTPSQATDAIPYKDGFANRVGGFGNTFSYRGFTLDAFFQFSFGQWAFEQTAWYFTRTLDFNMNLDRMVLDRWQQPGDITYFPRATLTGAAHAETADFRVQEGTHAVYNASYIRLKNVTLSYNAPRAITETLNVAGLRVFVSGVNLYTWTAWPFYDPEVAFGQTDIFNNLSAASYPTSLQVNAGVEINF